MFYKSNYIILFIFSDIIFIFHAKSSYFKAWLRWITVMETSGFIFSFGIGMNLVPWLLVGELCPPKVRAISSAIAVTVCAISIFAVVKVCVFHGT